MPDSARPIATSEEPISDLVGDPFAISAHIRRLNEELKVARALFRLAVKIRASAADGNIRQEASAHAR